MLSDDKHYCIYIFKAVAVFMSNKLNGVHLAKRYPVI